MSDPSNDWQHYEELYKPIYNRLTTTLKEIMSTLNNLTFPAISGKLNVVQYLDQFNLETLTEVIKKSKY